MWCYHGELFLWNFVLFSCICTHNLWKDKRANPFGNITWPTLGKQNVQAKGVYCGINCKYAKTAVHCTLLYSDCKMSNMKSFWKYSPRHLIKMMNFYIFSILVRSSEKTEIVGLIVSTLKRRSTVLFCIPTVKCQIWKASENIRMRRHAAVYMFTCLRSSCSCKQPQSLSLSLEANNKSCYLLPKRAIASNFQK